MTAFRAAFAAAARDYRWLLDRGYPSSASLKLVGDRHRLSAEERLVLFRGIDAEAPSALRRGRIATQIEGRTLLLDAYNVAFTLVHYLVGKPCFIATDGLLRDAGANYGRVPREELLARAFDELAAFIREKGADSVEAVLDAPVSRSAEHAIWLRRSLETAGLLARVELARSADGAIIARVASTDESPESPASPLVASSDSALVARVPAVYDLARLLLERRYGAVFCDLGALLA